MAYLLSVLRFFDLPPVWLIACGLLSYLLSLWLPLLSLSIPDIFAWGLIVLGVAIMIWAATLFFVNRTSIRPRTKAGTLVKSGPYRFSRNPIYLADLIILLGFVIKLGAVSALLGLPLFVVLMNWRFISLEEKQLAETFGEEWWQYRAGVRRWL